MRYFLALTIVLVGASCATSIHTSPLYLRTDGNLEQVESETLLAPANAQCRILSEKKIAYVLFALPTSSMPKENVKSPSGKALRYREVAYPEDVALSVLGFLLSVIVRTKVLEECETQAVVLSGEEARRYKQSLEKPVVEAPADKGAAVSDGTPPDPFKVQAGATTYRVKLKRSADADLPDAVLEGFITTADDKVITLKMRHRTVLIERANIDVIEVKEEK